VEHTPAGERFIVIHLRVKKTLSGIESPAFLGVEGAHYGRLITKALEQASWSRQHDINQALSLGERNDVPTNRIGRPIPTPSSRLNTDKRAAIRACLLAELAIKGKPTRVSGTLIQRFESLDIHALRAAFIASFPLIASQGVAHKWRDMTDPRQHNPARFRYIVHAIRLGQPQNHGGTSVWTSAATILANPDATLQTWLAISCSVIDQAHTATLHSSGLILKVPPGNILTTHHADQSFANHAGTKSAPNSSVPRHELAGRFIDEIRSKDVLYGGIKSPSEILARTGDRNSPYNEVVVQGTDKTQTQRVQTNGLFLRRSAEPAVAAVTRAAAVRLGLPLVEL
jgi:hypothetical protein